MRKGTEYTSHDFLTFVQEKHLLWLTVYFLTQQAPPESEIF